MKPRMEKMTKPAYTLVAQLVTLMMMLSLYVGKRIKINVGHYLNWIFFQFELCVSCIVVNHTGVLDP